MKTFAALLVPVLVSAALGGFMYWEASRTNDYGCPVYENAHECVVKKIKSK